MTYNLAAALCAATLWAQSAYAQDFSKNHLPCVQEICISDGIAELRKVPFDRAKNDYAPVDRRIYTSDRKQNELELTAMRDQYKGDTVAAAPYLVDKQFDSVALDALSRVRAHCGGGAELVGTYTSPSGNPTRVSIALSPGRGPTSDQRWMVTKLLRTIPSAVTDQQRKEATTELSARYKAFDLARTKNAKPGEARFAMSSGSLFGFHFFLFQGLEEVNRLRQHPLCGGTAKVKVD